MCKLQISESDNDQLDYRVSDENALRDLLNNLVQEVSRMVILEFEDGNIFTLGVGLPYGFIQHSISGESPYLVASVAGISDVLDSEGEIEFDANGTATPIQKRLCMPYERIVAIIIHFFKSHELPQYVEWEEM